MKKLLSGILFSWIVFLMMLAGCQPASSGNADSIEKEKTETWMHLQEETIQESLRGNYIQLDFHGDVEVPENEIPVFQGNLYTFSGQKQLEEFAEKCIEDYENKKSRMEYVESPVWGELYQYHPDDNYREKVQFPNRNVLLYYRTESGQYPSSEEKALQSAADFVKKLYPELENRVGDAIIRKNESLICYDIYFTLQIDDIVETDQGILFDGNDQFYQKEQIIVSVDNEGVCMCTNTICFQDYEIARMVEQEEWLQPSQVFEMLLEFFDVPSGSDYRFTDMKLSYVLAPMKGEDISEKMRLIPVWEIYGIQIFDEELQATEPTANVSYAVDAINGEIYKMMEMVY